MSATQTQIAVAEAEGYRDRLANRVGRRHFNTPEEGAAYAAGADRAEHDLLRATAADMARVKPARGSRV